MSIVTKQLIMNEIRLPMDMINIIKEYSFYNIVEETKKNKIKINIAIRSAEYTRANRNDDDPDYSDNDEHWSFGYNLSTTICETLQLQAENCSTCGNYIHYCHEFIIKAIVCHCLDPNLYSDDEDDNVSENNDEWMNIY